MSLKFLIDLNNKFAFNPVLKGINIFIEMQFEFNRQCGHYNLLFITKIHFNKVIYVNIFFPNSTKYGEVFCIFEPVRIY